MKIATILPLALAALTVPLLAADKPALKDQRDKVGYSIGVNIGSSLKQDGADVNIEALAAGLVDSYGGGALQLTPTSRRP